MHKLALKHRKSFKRVSSRDEMSILLIMMKKILSGIPINYAYVVSSHIFKHYLHGIALIAKRSNLFIKELHLSNVPTAHLHTLLRLRGRFVSLAL